MRISIIIIAVVLAVGSVVSGCSHPAKNSDRKILKVDSVAVFTLKKSAVNKKLTFPAELTPLERAEIYAKVNGYVKEFKVDIGDRVKKGQIMAILDAPEIGSNYAQANSELQTAKSKYVASLDIYNRILNASKVEGTIAAGELERAKNQITS